MIMGMWVMTGRKKSSYRLGLDDDVGVYIKVQAPAHCGLIPSLIFMTRITHGTRSERFVSSFSLTRKDGCFEATGGT